MINAVVVRRTPRRRQWLDRGRWDAHHDSSPWVNFELSFGTDRIVREPSGWFSPHREQPRRDHLSLSRSSSLDAHLPSSSDTDWKIALVSPLHYRDLDSSPANKSHRGHTERDRRCIDWNDWDPYENEPRDGRERRAISYCFNELVMSKWISCRSSSKSIAPRYPIRLSVKRGDAINFKHSS